MKEGPLDGKNLKTITFNEEKQLKKKLSIKKRMDNSLSFKTRFSMLELVPIHRFKGTMKTGSLIFLN